MAIECDEPLDSELLDKIYSQLVLDGMLRITKRDFPYSYLEDQLTSCMCWEMFCMLHSTIKNSNLWRNQVNGNYIYELYCQGNEKTTSQIRQELTSRFDQLYYEFVDSGGITAAVQSVEKKTDPETGKDMVRVTVEFMMPPKERYLNILRYVGESPRLC
jgi:hypothetical protein